MTVEPPLLHPDLHNKFDIVVIVMTTDIPYTISTFRVSNVRVIGVHALGVETVV